MPTSPILAPLTGAILLALASPVLADPTAGADPDARQLDRVKVTGQRIAQPSSPKLGQPLLDTPQTITVVPARIIEQRAATSLREVLRNVSGISLVAGEGGAAQGDNLRIRGFAANTDLFVDGARDIAQYSRDPFNLESVEVVKGPASAYSGRGSTGGSVNLVSKAPRLREFAGASLLLGTDQTRRITADINQPVGETSAFRLNVMAHEATVADRDVVETERFGFAPSFAFGLGTDTRVTASYFHLKEDGIPDYGLPLVAGVQPVELDRSNWYGFRSLNTEETRTDVGTLRVEHAFNDALKLHNQLRYSRSDRYSIVTAPRSPSVATDQVSINPTGRDSGNTQLINQTDLTWRFGNAGMRHTVIAGLELSREDFENQAIAFSGPGGVPTSVRPNTTRLRAPNPDQVYLGTRSLGAFSDSRGDTIAAYVFDTIELGERWQLNGGLRHDRFGAESETRATTGLRTTVRRDDSFTSGRLGVVFKPAPNGSIYAAYATSFNPSAEGGVIGADPTAPSANASALVAPEENRSVEVGTKWELNDGRLQLNAALFRTDKTHARTPGLPGEPFTVLDGEQRVRGLELGAIGQVTERWDVFAGYTWMDSEILRSNNPLEQGQRIGNTPGHSASLWTTYRLPGNIEIGAGAQYIGERAVSSTVATDLPAYWLTDAMIAWKASDTLDFRLNLFNLDDAFYLERLHAGGAHGVPGAGRTAMLTVNFTF